MLEKNETLPMGPEAQAQEAAREAQALLSRPYLTSVRTQGEYEQNAAHVVAMKAKGKELEAKRTSITGPLNASLKIINDLFRGPAEALKRGIESCEYPMKIFIREQDRIRQEAEAAARKAAEAERKRQEDARKAAEAEMLQARLDEVKATEAAAAQVNPFLAAADEARAETAAEAGRVARETAEAAIREQRRIESSPLASAIPQVKATGTRINRPWKWEVTDKALIPPEYWILNEQLLSATVRNLKGDTAIPGIHAYEDISIGGR